MTTTDTSEAARALLNTMPIFTRMIDSVMRDVTREIALPHFLLLKLLAQRQMSQSELAAIHQVNPSTMSATLDALHKRGWITRERSEQDRRIVQIEITAQGRRMIESFDDRAIAGIEALLEPLGEAELAQLMAGIEVMQRIFMNGLQKSQPDMWREPPFPPPFPMPFNVPVPPPVIMPLRGDIPPETPPREDVLFFFKQEGDDSETLTPPMV